MEWPSSSINVPAAYLLVHSSSGLLFHGMNSAILTLLFKSQTTNFPGFAAVDTTIVCPQRRILDILEAIHWHLQDISSHGFHIEGCAAAGKDAAVTDERLAGGRRYGFHMRR